MEELVLIGNGMVGHRRIEATTTGGVDAITFTSAPAATGLLTHAVETAIARLRTALGDADTIRTVVKRGYRLALDTHPY